MHHEPTLLNHPSFSFSQACRLPKNLPPSLPIKTPAGTWPASKNMRRATNWTAPQNREIKRLPHLARFCCVHSRGFQLLENCRKNQVRNYQGRHQNDDTLLDAIDRFGFRYQWASVFFLGTVDLQWLPLITAAETRQGLKGSSRQFAEHSLF